MKLNAKKFLSVLCLTSVFSGFLTQSLASAAEIKGVVSDTKCESTSDCKKELTLSEEEVLPDGTIKKCLLTEPKKQYILMELKRQCILTGLKK